MPSPVVPSTRSRTSQRCAIAARMIRSSMGASSVVVAGAGFFDVGLDQEALLGHVVRAWLESPEHLDPLAVASAQFQHPHLIGLTDLREHDGEVAEALQPRFPDRQRHAPLRSEEHKSETQSLFRISY